MMSDFGRDTVAFTDDNVVVNYKWLKWFPYSPYLEVEQYYMEKYN